ncbi:Protein N-terminal asparagine amidohydrolase [Microtus ochrogaster]|uniref:Protein N-terminal asparagine amidohydrolase n=1 Tax=Microtus ochrogaster TaxID=79684 RepID=A0A8J6G4V0_MICOH|nr:Protein N-terminal asparagine amidohydrolase [Microtus ochrogaster]
MPLLVDGRRVRLPRSAAELVRAHPLLEVSGIALACGQVLVFRVDNSVILSGPVQRSLVSAVVGVEPKALHTLDIPASEMPLALGSLGGRNNCRRSVSILGSDDATTCHIVVLRHTGNGATCLTHCDGTDTKAEVPLIMSSIKSFSDHAQCGRLEVHLVGGFSDDRQLSQKLTHQLLSEFDKQDDDIHLVTLCVTELNDREENENHFPIIYGIGMVVYCQFRVTPSPLQLSTLKLQRFTELPFKIVAQKSSFVLQEL